MIFIFFAVTVIAWSLSMLGWVFVFRGRAGRTVMILMSAVMFTAAAASIAADVHTIHLGLSAPRSDLDIEIVGRGDWWQLDYSKAGVAFTTANEMHVPAGVAVHLHWANVPPPSLDHAACFPTRNGDCTLIAEEGASRARLMRLWPPMLRDLHVIAERTDRFDRWFQNEAHPAAMRGGDGPFLFESSGCSYCHVIRGVISDPSQVAPDLTHFAARRTIAGTDYPIETGFLTGWVVHSRGVKRESAMPDNAIDPRVLHRLIAYLQSLR